MGQLSNLRLGSRRIAQSRLAALPRREDRIHFYLRGTRRRTAWQGKCDVLRTQPNTLHHLQWCAGLCANSNVRSRWAGVFICLCFYQVQDAVAVHWEIGYGSLIHNHIIQCSWRVHVPTCVPWSPRQTSWHCIYTTWQDVECCLSVPQVSAVNRFSPPLEVVAAQDHRTNTKLAVQNKPASLRFRFTSSSPAILPSFLSSFSPSSLLCQRVYCNSKTWCSAYEVPLSLDTLIRPSYTSIICSV